jgi:hypothetical protein
MADLVTQHDAYCCEGADYEQQDGGQYQGGKAQFKESPFWWCRWCVQMLPLGLQLANIAAAVGVEFAPWMRTVEFVVADLQVAATVPLPVWDWEVGALCDSRVSLSLDYLCEKGSNGLGDGILTSSESAMISVGVESGEARAVGRPA